MPATCLTDPLNLPGAALQAVYFLLVPRPADPDIGKCISCALPHTCFKTTFPLDISGSHKIQIQICLPAAHRTHSVLPLLSMTLCQPYDRLDLVFLAFISL